MYKPKTQPVVASAAEIQHFTRQRSGRIRRVPIKLQAVQLTIEFNGLKQEITKEVIHGKSFVDDALDAFNFSKITAMIDGKKYLSTTLGNYLTKKRQAKRPRG